MKLTCLFSFLLLLPTAVFAQFIHAPDNFDAPEGHAVFVDFKSADYQLTYDPAKKTAVAHSIIKFETLEEAMPVFDLVENPTAFLLDGEAVTTKIICSNDLDTWFRIVLKSIKPGAHTFEVTSPISQGVSFVQNGVSSAFWLNDLGDRAFLEAYLPANFEYDQYKMTFNIDFKNMSAQKIISNGLVTKGEGNTFKVEFPATYTSSSPYFHTAPIGYYPERSFIFTSIDGRQIPTLIYSKDTYINLDNAKERITGIITNLESKFGPWMHKKIIVFIAGNGGMEYCGATMSDMGSMSHELTHSYFARGGFMPANGNAGWIDEAITTWSDSGSGSRPNLNGIMANMAGQSQYRRYTENRAYSIGAAFMAYLNYKFQAVGGLNAFLNNLILTSAFSPMTTEEFYTKMSSFYSEDLTALFRDHVYKNSNKIKGSTSAKPNHMKMTIPEMAQYL